MKHHRLRQLRLPQAQLVDHRCRIGMPKEDGEQQPLRLAHTQHAPHRECKHGDRGLRNAHLAPCCQRQQQGLPKHAQVTHSAHVVAEAARNPLPEPEPVCKPLPKKLSTPESATIDSR